MVPFNFDIYGSRYCAQTWVIPKDEAVTAYAAAISPKEWPMTSGGLDTPGFQVTDESRLPCGAEMLGESTLRRMTRLVGLRELDDAR